MTINDLISQKDALIDNITDTAKYIASGMRVMKGVKPARSAQDLFRDYHQSMQQLEDDTVLLHTLNNTITYEGKTIQQYMAHYDTLCKRIGCLNSYIESLTSRFNSGGKLIVDVNELQNRMECLIKEKGHLYALIRHINWSTNAQPPYQG